MTSTKSPLKIPIFVALDVDDDKFAVKIVEQTREFVGGFKLGPRLINRYGQKLIKDLSESSLVFVDCKFHDIPSTVLSAVQATFESGASYATVHASNGRVCLTELSALEKKLNQIRYFKILAVTVLTSFKNGELPKNWSSQDSFSNVKLLAEDVHEAGLSGLVCAPTEVEFLRAKYSKMFLLTPGIRPHFETKNSESRKDDQARVMGPREALHAGSSALVIGRPIIEAKNPREAARAICESISSNE